MHVPVLLKEVIEYLNPRPNENFIDCTIGGGGHAFEILKYTRPSGKLLGIDWNEEAIRSLKERISSQKLENRIILIQGNFADLKNIIQEYKFFNVNGILADLGISLDEILQSGRGFSFMKDEPLDMRYSLKNQLTAEEILNDWPWEELEKIL